MDMKHFLSNDDLSGNEILDLLKIAQTLKAEFKSGILEPCLNNKTVGLIFHKPSLRTRVSFEVGVNQMGGSSLFMEGDIESFGVRESIKDHAKVISRFVDAIVMRTFDHYNVTEFAKHATIPIINGLTDYNHPCQAIADLLTMTENFDKLEGKKLSFIGDGNNVSRSLAIVCSKLKMPFFLAHPKGYGFEDSFIDQFTEEEKSFITQTEDPREAADNCSAFYSDVFASMGQEDEKESRLKLFKDYQVNQKLVDLAAKDAIILHCLPAHRGEEITAEVIDGPRSRIYDQSENRMHAQKAIMKVLLS